MTDSVVGKLESVIAAVPMQTTDSVPEGTLSLKKCTKCGMTRERKDFYKRKSSKDGLKPECKDCSNGY
jgi:hypothetical protein